MNRHSFFSFNSLRWGHSAWAPGLLLILAGCVTEDLQETRNRDTNFPANYTLPYDVRGITYYPLVTSRGFSQSGVASWYGPKFHGKLTSNKEVYDMNALTAAHKTLPFGTVVRVVNQENGKEAVVRINDRGPFVNDRIIDMSRRAAEALGMLEQGTARVKITALNEVAAHGGTPSNRVFPGQDKFSIQLAVFKKPENAGQMKREFKNSRIRAFFRKGTKYYRILIGSHPTFEEAVKHRNSIRLRGFPNAFIVRAH